MKHLLDYLLGFKHSPDDVRLPHVKKWGEAKVQPKTPPLLTSKAKRLPGDANAYVWPDAGVHPEAGNLTPLEWGHIVAGGGTKRVDVAATVKKLLAQDKTHTQVAFEASRLLDDGVSVSVVSKISAALSKAARGETKGVVAIPEQNENESTYSTTYDFSE